MFESLEFIQPEPEWSAKRDSIMGYGRATFVNNTHLFYEFRGLDTRTTLDSFWLIKQQQQHVEQ